ncbi:MAG: sugar phosphate isomerase/epimerase family protein [Candidatus Excrementavichristensenella sp.]|jgi:D-psicose/D-tagatose/L-ribulose 3-epimerase
MKFGIYFAYWETEWRGDYKAYIEKAAKLGFDVMELSYAPMPGYSEAYMQELRACAKANGITLTAGYGPTADQNISSSDPSVVANGMAFFREMLRRLEKMGIRSIGGGLYSYWPVDYSKPIDRERDRAIALKNVRELGKEALDRGVDFCLECLNRYEGYLLNTAKEGVEFLQEVDVPSVKLLLDTFHMNIEEDSMPDAILTAGPYLRRLHTGEANRRVPGQGGLPWNDIGRALRAIDFQGDVVMEPFVRAGGTIGREIKVWRQLVDKVDEGSLDRDALRALQFSRFVLGRQ